MEKFSNDFGEVCFTPMAGCSAVVISHAMQIYPKYRGKGMSRQNLALRMSRAKQNGYGLMIATVRADNAAEQHLLSTTAGWTMAYAFKNPKTQADLTLWVCDTQVIELKGLLK